MLRHRGPDGHGWYLDDHAGLAHTRLALVDLHGGHQPLHNEDRTLWLVGNGEIFGHRAQRARLQELGHHFATGSDLEVVLHAYEEWGERAWAELDGQFAFALWDRPRRSLWLVRDRFGITPLHWTRCGDRVRFASEAKALFAAGGAAPTFDPQALAAAFVVWAVPPPRTVFAGVEVVPPGTALCFDRHLRVRTQRWWHLELRPEPPRPLAATAAELRKRLDRAVALRLDADLPVGTYLSGGLDSSLLTALAARQRPGLPSFALRFADPEFDETGPQRAAAAALGTDHHELCIGDRDVRDGLPAMVWHAEAPLLRTAPVPMFLLSAFVRRNGIHAVLSGEGADELLGGYSVFQEDRVRRFWARQPGSRARPALLQRVHDFVATPEQRRGAMWQAFYAAGLQDTEAPFYSHLRRWQNDAWTLRMLAPDVRAAAAAAPPLAAIAQALPPGFADFTPLGRAQAIEIATFLGPWLLGPQGDRATLAHGVEGRYPFLDPEVAAFCAALPDHRKLRGLRTKVALREAAAPLLPPAVASRPKQPYRAPTASALLGRAPSDYVDELLSPARLSRTGLLDASAVLRLVEKARRAPHQRLAEREAMAVVGALSVQLLADAFVDGFAARAAAADATLCDVPPTVAVDARCALLRPGASP